MENISGETVRIPKDWPFLEELRIEVFDLAGQRVAYPMEGIAPLFSGPTGDKDFVSLRPGEKYSRAHPSMPILLSKPGKYSLVAKLGLVQYVTQKTWSGTVSSEPVTIVVIGDGIKPK